MKFKLARLSSMKLMVIGADSPVSPAVLYESRGLRETLVTHGHRCSISRPHARGEAEIIVSFIECYAMRATLVNYEISSYRPSLPFFFHLFFPPQINRTRLRDRPRVEEKWAE